MYNGVLMFMLIIKINLRKSLKTFKIMASINIFIKWNLFCKNCLNIYGSVVIRTQHQIIKHTYKI